MMMMMMMMNVTVPVFFNDISVVGQWLEALQLSDKT